MTAGASVATAPSLDRLQAAVDDAARHLYDAEAALHIARQAGVGSWISAAYDRLHEAVAGHLAAVEALEGRNRALPPAHPCAPPACGRVSLAQLAAGPSYPKNAYPPTAAGLSPRP